MTDSYEGMEGGGANKTSVCLGVATCELVDVIRWVGTTGIRSREDASTAGKGLRLALRRACSASLACDHRCKAAAWTESKDGASLANDRHTEESDEEMGSSWGNGSGNDDLLTTSLDSLALVVTCEGRNALRAATKEVDALTEALKAGADTMASSIRVNAFRILAIDCLLLQ